MDLVVGVQAAAMEAGQELLVGQGQQLGHLGQAEAVLLQPLDLQKADQLLLPVVAIAVLPHLIGAEETQSVVVPQHPGGDPAQPGKLADGEHDIPPI